MLPAYASVEDYIVFWCLGPEDDLDDAARATIASMLELGSAQLHMARAAQGVSDGELSEEARLYLRYLNVLIAAVINHCPCGTARLDDAAEKTWLYEIAKGLEDIRTGEYPLVAGGYGASVPYGALVGLDYTSFTRAAFLERAEWG